MPIINYFMNVYHNGFIFEGVDNIKPYNAKISISWQSYLQTFPKVQYIGSRAFADYQEVIEGEDYIKQHQLKSANPGTEEWYTPFYLEDFHNTTDMSQKRIVAISKKEMKKGRCKNCKYSELTLDKNPCNMCDGLFNLWECADSHKETKEPNVPADINGQEYILCAATWYKDLFTAKILPINIKTGVVLCGYRHGDIIYQLLALTGMKSVTPVCGDYEQGFITNKNRFVGRKEAFPIARDADQIKGPNKGQSENPIGLTSEDLY
jgi:predicted nucleic-acid-binding Zn-ribbon protein